MSATPFPPTYNPPTPAPKILRTSQNSSQKSPSPRPSSPSSQTSNSSNRVLSSFNPSIYYIPPHGGLTTSKPCVPIIDLTTKLKLKSTEVGSKPYRTELRAAVSEYKAQAKATAKTPESVLERDTTLYSRKHSRLSSKSSIEVPISREDGSRSGKGEVGRQVAEWKVPWDLGKPATVTFLAEKKKIAEVAVKNYDTRAQQFIFDNARYVWRFTKENELSLEKEMPGYKYLVAIFYLKGFFTTTSGTLLVDERGVDLVLAVSTIMICLKRERQRRSILFSTD
ncbi:hypothetical protein RUND412_007489 [Rhizina undulata]